MLKISNISKKFNKRLILDDLTIEVKPGELYCFLGPNGAGKTTTIKIATGILKPDSGSVVINGFDLKYRPMEARRSFGYIPDNPFLYERLTPREFLRFVGGLFRLEPLECDRKIDYWLERFDLQPYEQELMGAFSHGMRQKVAFIAAFLHDPKVLIVDEPMVGLDPRGVLFLKSVFRESCTRGITAFLSTHSLEIAEQISDRIGILYKGTLVAEGSMEQLRDLVKNQGGRLEEIFLEITETQQDKSANQALSVPGK